MGYFPAAWREAVVRPFPKNLNSKGLSDLRPISMLPLFSKLLERIVYEQVFLYVNDNSILPRYQLCFRKGYSTVHPLPYWRLGLKFLRHGMTNKLQLLFRLIFQRHSTQFIMNY